MSGTYQKKERGDRGLAKGVKRFDKLSVNGTPLHLGSA